MKYLFFLNLLIFSALAQDMNSILESHDQRLLDHPNKELNFYEELVAKGIRKFGGRGLNERMVNYLARHDQLILKFKKATEQAQKYSREMCNVQDSSNLFFIGRHVDDEVDALRHLLWSGLLHFYMQEEYALILTSLQEDRPENNRDSLKMDLWNNFQAIDKVNFLVKHSTQRLNAATIRKEMFELLKNGKAKVLKTGKSECSFPQFYPNLNDENN